MSFFSPLHPRDIAQPSAGAGEYGHIELGVNGDLSKNQGCVRTAVQNLKDSTCIWKCPRASKS